MKTKNPSIFHVFAALIAFMAIFPPFTFYQRDGVKFNLGYQFILTPPQHHGIPGDIDVAVLLIQLLCVVLFFWGNIHFIKSITKLKNTNRTMLWKSRFSKGFVRMYYMYSYKPLYR